MKTTQIVECKHVPVDNVKDKLWIEAKAGEESFYQLVISTEGDIPEILGNNFSGCCHKNIIKLTKFKYSV